MRRAVFAGFAALLVAAAASAELRRSFADPQAVFEEGNEAFEKGKIEEARGHYESLVKHGYESAALYYNLGNVHDRKGERGRAVLWYERAARLDPRDGDIRYNLSLARSHVKDAEPSLQERFLLYFTPTELGWAALAFLWIFFLLLAGRAIGGVPAAPWAAAATWSAGLLLALSAGWFAGTLYVNRVPKAVVVAPPGEVRNGPGEDYAVGFTVPEGSTVLILNRRPEWVQVGVPQQGLKGWMPTAGLGFVNPTAASIN